MIEERYAVRALLLSPDGAILLMRVRPPHDAPGFWIAPGGGLQSGEGVEEGLRRELQEELGLTEFEIGPIVWRRHHTFNWGSRRIAQEEEYRIVHVARFAPQMSDPAEARTLDCFRWWPLADLASSEEPMAPSSLSKIISDYLANGSPLEPLHVERLVD